MALAYMQKHTYSPALQDACLDLIQGGAGALPLRFVLRTQSDACTEIRGDQTFLIDGELQAWPLLTYGQANRRVSRHVELGKPAKGAVKPAILLTATGALVGAAAGVVSGGDSAAEGTGRGATAGAAAGTVIGGAKSYQEIGYQIREDLVNHSFEYWSSETGEIADGFLFLQGHQ